MLRADEILDQKSYLYRRCAEKYQAKADTYRHEAYSTRSRVNNLFAQALKFKERAYQLESKAKHDQDPVWMKIYILKSHAFALEQKANLLNSRVYQKKKIFYILSAKASGAAAKFTELKSRAYAKKVAIHAPGECGLKDKKH